MVVDGTLDVSNLSGTVSAKTISSTSSGLGRILIGGDRLTITNANGIFYGAISGTGSLEVTGGTLTLAGANTFTGGIYITNATLKYADNAGALSNGSITSSNGSLGARSDMPLITLGTAINITGAIRLVGDVKSTGNQNYQNVVVAPASGTLVTITSTGGNIQMLGTIDGVTAGTQSLTLVSNAASGYINLVGSNGATTPLKDFTVTANRINVLADTLTSGVQTYNGSSFIGDASYVGQTITQGFLFGQYNSTFTDATKGLLIKYLSPNYVRTLVSRDPSVTFNGTIDDTVKNTHTLIMLAISDVSSLDPSITFTNSIGSTVPLYGLNVATTKTGSTYGGSISFTGLGVTTYTNQSYSANSMNILPLTSGSTITFTISDVDGLINFNVNPVDPDYPGYIYIRGELNPTPVVVSNYLAIKGTTNIRVAELNGTWNATITSAYVPVTPSTPAAGGGDGGSGSSGGYPVISPVVLTPAIEPISKEKSSTSGTPTTNAGTIMQNIDANNNFAVYRPASTSVSSVTVSMGDAGAATQAKAGPALASNSTSTSTSLSSTSVSADNPVAGSSGKTSSIYILAKDQPPAQVVSGSAFVYKLPSDTFTHSVAGTPMQYEAKQADGSALPGWMKFNSNQLSFSGTAPADAAPAYDIVILAKDRQGNQASARVVVRVSSK